MANTLSLNFASRIERLEISIISYNWVIYMYRGMPTMEGSAAYGSYFPEQLLHYVQNLRENDLICGISHTIATSNGNNTTLAAIPRHQDA